MSAKWRMVLWFTLMMLLLAGVTLTFVLVMNGSVIANPTSQVVREVSRRADDIEFDNGTFDWDDMKEYKHGVYCTYYDAGGTYLRGAMPFAEAVALPLQTGAVRPYSADGKDWLVYDSYVDMTITGLWVRGVISADAAAGPGRVILPAHMVAAAGAASALDRRRLAHRAGLIPPARAHHRSRGQHFRRRRSLRPA